MKKILFSTLIIGGLLISSASIAEAKISKYGPTAKCKDGTYSYSANHRGTCSHHKGVKVWYR